MEPIQEVRDLAQTAARLSHLKTCTDYLSTSLEKIATMSVWDSGLYPKILLVFPTFWSTRFSAPASCIRPISQRPFLQDA